MGRNAVPVGRGRDVWRFRVCPKPRSRRLKEDGENGGGSTGRMNFSCRGAHCASVPRVNYLFICLLGEGPHMDVAVRSFRTEPLKIQS